MVQIFYCTHVDLGNGGSLYWAEDTSIECYKDSHKYLVIFAGGPLLVFICLGFPVSLFVNLYLKRKTLHSAVMVSRYGYFYQAYCASHAYWEVLVELRKGLLAVISVLSHTLSEELKLYVSSIVLLLAVALQTHCSPYKAQKLNRMETASLFITAFVCILQGVTISPEANSNLETVMSAGILVLLLSFVVYVIVELALSYKKPIYDWLIQQDEFAKHTGGLASFFKVWSQIAASRFNSQTSTVKSTVQSMVSNVLEKKGQGVDIKITF